MEFTTREYGSVWHTMDDSGRFIRVQGAGWVIMRGFIGGNSPIAGPFDTLDAAKAAYLLTSESTK